MIASLYGILRFKSPGHLTVEVNGIGYRVFIPLSTFYELADEGSPVALNVFTAVREDAIHLYGFCTPEEKQLFELLLSVNGIGPKLAINLLSGIASTDFIRAVFTEDRQTLTKIPGVGKKMADRIILELRDRVIKLAPEQARDEVKVESSLDAIREDALSALVNLGYKKSYARSVLDQIADGSSQQRTLEESLEGSPEASVVNGTEGTESRISGMANKEERNPLVVPENLEKEHEEEGSLRPRTLTEYVGQERVKESLAVFIEAARKRGEALDHVLLSGPPGLGKTTLAYILSREMGVGIKVTSGPVIERQGDLAAILTNLQEHDVLFIDEIHRLPNVVEEILYPAMEDYHIDILVGQGPSARSMKLNIPRFTLVGATTRAGLLTSPLRDRFGMSFRLEFYNPEELATIVRRSSKILNIQVDDYGASEIAGRSRGTPRIANRLLRRVRDYAEVRANGIVTRDVAARALEFLEVDHRGFDSMDRKLLLLLIDKFNGGPVGIDSLSSSLGEERNTIEDVYEPFLVQEGYIVRTARGRVATKDAYAHFGRAWVGNQKELF